MDKKVTEHTTITYIDPVNAICSRSYLDKTLSHEDPTLDYEMFVGSLGPMFGQYGYSTFSNQTYIYTEESVTGIRYESSSLKWVNDIEVLVHVPVLLNVDESVPEDKVIVTYEGKEYKAFACLYQAVEADIKYIEKDLPVTEDADDSNEIAADADEPISEEGVAENAESSI